MPVQPRPLSPVALEMLRDVVDRRLEAQSHAIPLLGAILTSGDDTTNAFEETKRFLDQDIAWRGKRFDAHMTDQADIAYYQEQQILILEAAFEDAKLALAEITNELLDRLAQV